LRHTAADVRVDIGSFAFKKRKQSWLIFTTNVYDFSVKLEQVVPTKVYAVDNDLANAVDFSFSPNAGRLLENLVFWPSSGGHRRSTTTHRRPGPRWPSICRRPIN
jgi:hypothetical protein